MAATAQRISGPPAATRASMGPLRTAWFLLMLGANLAAPLYPIYAADFGFSSLVLTAVFATYAFVLVPALLVFGGLSDRFGRRRVMVGGLLCGCLGLAVFAAAQGTA